MVPIILLIIIIIIIMINDNERDHDHDHDSIFDYIINDNNPHHTTSNSDSPAGQRKRGNGF